MFAPLFTYITFREIYSNYTTTLAVIQAGLLLTPEEFLRY